MSEKLLSTAEAASRLGVTRRQVQRLAKGGDLPRAFKVGYAWLIPKADLDDYIKKARASGENSSR